MHVFMKPQVTVKDSNDENISVVCDCRWHTAAAVLDYFSGASCYVVELKKEEETIRVRFDGNGELSGE